MQIFFRSIGRRALAGLSAGLIAVASSAQPARSAPTIAPAVAAEAAEQEVAAVDDEYVAAELRRDEATMRRLVDDRFVFNDARGTTTGKEAFLQRVLNLPLIGDSVRERSILIEGNVALVFATADLRLGSRDQPESVSLLSLRYTCVYIRREGAWRMLALQMEPRTGK